MSNITPNSRARKPWKLAAEILFVVWVITINFLYYAQFKHLAYAAVARLLRR